MQPEKSAVQAIDEIVAWIASAKSLGSVAEARQRVRGGSANLADPTIGSPRRVRSPHLDVEPIAEGEAQPIGE